MTFLLSIWTALKSKLAGYAVAIATVLAVLAGAYLKGRSDSAAAVTKDRLRAVTKARTIEDEISSMGDADVDAALRQWMRDK